MDKKDLKTASLIQQRIDELEAEIMALFDAQGKKVNPLKPFTVRGQIYGNYVSEKEITLTKHDITILQMVRSEEQDRLKEMLDKL